MPVLELNEVALQDFPGGATYQTLVGDTDGTTPVRIGIQVSPPGYSTGTHSHPYLEVITVLEGEGEAWIGDEPLSPLTAGSTMLLPPNVPHGFRAIGAGPLKTYGVHASSERIVHRPDADLPNP
jgi:quercetin dioxygenase-like cupin family protein